VQKTFCDRCGEPCVNLTVLVQVTDRHTTAAGELAGADEYRPAELCGTCGTAAKAALPELRLGYHHEGDSPIAREVPG